MIAGINISQEIFVTDMLRALKPSIELTMPSILCDFYDHMEIVT